MTPKTWTDVLIERAKCEGWLRGHNGFHWEGEPLDTLSRLRPCDACGGSGWDFASDKHGDDCRPCHGSGIAPEGDDK
jgi:hypothetical protein